MTGDRLPLFSRNLRAWVDPADVFVTLFAKAENAFWLDREHHPEERFSIMGNAPSGSAVGNSEVFAASKVWPKAWASADVQTGEATPGNWSPGYVGWFNYQGNPLDEAELTGKWLPADSAIILDHDARSIWLTGVFAAGVDFDEWVKSALIRLGLSGGQRIGYLQRHHQKTTAKLTFLAHPPKEYADLVRRAKAHIAAGDVYQVCLTNRLQFTHDADPLATFLRLRALNPAPYASYIRVGATALVSVSPEQFLTVNADGLAVTRPIKGTRARGEAPEEDAALAAELAAHPKEQAENLMIVDLMRSDLARVAEPDTVTVTELFAVEAHPTVHQLVSTVTAQLSSSTSLESLVRATFPAGSMTGAPKIRAMQIIAALEGVPRGTYSGAAGFISTDGGLDLGMIIRSLVFEGDQVSLGVGGGITIDSDPDFEVAETELKALSLLRVLGVESPWS